MTDHRYTLTQAAYRLGVPPTTMYGWYETDRGPRGFKIGGRIFYLRSELDAWTEAEMAATSRGGNVRG